MNAPTLLNDRRPREDARAGAINDPGSAVSITQVIVRSEADDRCDSISLCPHGCLEAGRKSHLVHVSARWRNADGETAPGIRLDTGRRDGKTDGRITLCRA